MRNNSNSDNDRDIQLTRSVFVIPILGKGQTFRFFRPLIERFLPVGLQACSSHPLSWNHSAELSERVSGTRLADVEHPSFPFLFFSSPDTLLCFLPPIPWASQLAHEYTPPLLACK